MTNGMIQRLKIMLGIMLLAGMMLVLSFALGFESPGQYVEYLQQGPGIMRFVLIITFELITGTEFIYRTTYARKERL